MTKIRKEHVIGVAVLALFLCAIPVFASGGQEKASATASGPAHLTWMTWGTTSHLQEVLNDLFKAEPALAQKFDVKFVLGGAGDPDVANKLRLDMAANSNFPDISQLNYTQLPEFAANGLAQNLESVYTGKILDNLFQATKALARYDGKYVAFPSQIKTKLWYYRKDLFDKAGIDPAKITNLNDFIAAGKKLHAMFPNSYIWNIGNPIAGYDLGMVVSGNGAKYFNSQGHYIVNTDPGVREAFTMFKTLLDSGVTVNIQDFTPDWEKAFANGTIASSLISNWFSEFLPGYAPKEAGKWAVAQWPTLGGANGGSEAGGSVQIVVSKSRNVKAAEALLSEVFFTDQGALASYTAIKNPPVIRSAWNQAIFHKPDNYFVGTTFLDQDKVALDTYRLQQFGPHSDKERSIMNDALTQYLFGHQSLDAVLNQAESTLNNQIGNALQ